MKNVKQISVSVLELLVLSVVFVRTQFPFLPTDILPAFLPLLLSAGIRLRERLLLWAPGVLTVSQLLLAVLFPAAVPCLPAVNAVFLMVFVFADAALSYRMCWSDSLHCRRRKICKNVSQLLSRLLAVSGMAWLATLALLLFPGETRTWGSVAFRIGWWLFLAPVLAIGGWLLRCALQKVQPVFSSRTIRTELKALQEKENDARKVSKDSDPARELFGRAVEMMRSKRPFLLYEFTIHDMAQRLYTNKTYLSRTINTFSGRGFRSFVNFFRIQYSIQLFRGNMALKVHTLAELSGFHSQVTYTTAFKLEMGITPGEYYSRLIQGLDVPKLPASPSMPMGH